MFDKNASKPHKLAIELRSFSPQSSRKFVSDGYRLESAELNNDGSQIALTNRGRLFIMPTWAGGSINLGKTSGVRYRSLCWLHSKNWLSSAIKAKKKSYVFSNIVMHHQRSGPN